MNKNILAEEKLEKLLIKFAVPATLAFIISSLYNIADQMFIGHGVGYLGNAATTVIFPVTIFALAFALLVGEGASSALSIALGKKQTDKAAKEIGNSFTLIIIVGIVYLLFLVIFSEQILLLFGATENNISYAREYFTYIKIGMPFFIFTTGMNSLVRADSRPKNAMFSMMVGAVINIVLDALFVLVFGWGMMGAGLATAIGQIASALLVGYYVLKPRCATLHISDFKLEKKIITSFLPLGISSFITQIAIVVTMLVLNSVMVKYGAMSEYGEDIPLAIMGIVSKVFSLVMAFIIGIAVGSQPIVGYNMGAGNYDRVRKLYWLVFRLELLVGLIATVIFMVFPTQIVSIFGSGDELYTEFGAIAFRSYLSLTAFVCIQKSSAIFLQALGKPVFSMCLSLVREFVLMVPLMFLLGSSFGVTAILYSAPIADAVSFVVTMSVIYIVFKRLDVKQESPELIKQPA